MFGAGATAGNKKAKPGSALDNRDGNKWDPGMSEMSLNTNDGTSHRVSAKTAKSQVDDELDLILDAAEQSLEQHERPPRLTALARSVPDMVIQATAVIATMSALYESLPSNESEPMPVVSLVAFEIWISIVFVADLVANIAMVFPLDQSELTLGLLVLIPSAAHFLVVSLGMNSDDMRWLHAIKSLRLLKLQRFSELYFFLWEIIYRSLSSLTACAFCLINVGVFAAAVIYVLEEEHPLGQFYSIPNCMWFAVVTMSTVGYGDQVPASDAGKLWGAFSIFIGLCFLSMPLALVGHNCVVVWQDKDKIHVARKLKSKFTKNSESPEKFIETAFEMLDKDKSGQVALLEFATGLGKLNLTLSRGELWTLWTALDADGSGLIDYSEFSHFIMAYGGHHLPNSMDLVKGNEESLKTMENVVNARISLSSEMNLLLNGLQKQMDKNYTVAHIRALVNNTIFKFDADNNGLISREELSKGLLELGVDFDTHALMLLWTQLDEQDKGQLEYSNLANFLCAHLQHRIAKTVACEASDSTVPSIDRGSDKTQGVVEAPQTTPSILKGNIRTVQVLGGAASEFGRAGQRAGGLQVPGDAVSLMQELPEPTRHNGMSQGMSQEGMEELQEMRKSMEEMKLMLQGMGSATAISTQYPLAASSKRPKARPRGTNGSKTAPSNKEMGAAKPLALSMSARTEPQMPLSAKGTGPASFRAVRLKKVKKIVKKKSPRSIDNDSEQMPPEKMDGMDQAC